MWHDCKSLQSHSTEMYMMYWTKSCNLQQDKTYVFVILVEFVICTFRYFSIFFSGLFDIKPLKGHNISCNFLFAPVSIWEKMDKPTSQPQTAEPPGIEIPFHRQQEAQHEPTSHGTSTTTNEGPRRLLRQRPKLEAVAAHESKSSPFQSHIPPVETLREGSEAKARMIVMNSWIL